MAVVAAAHMPDFLTLYASSQPGELAVIDDRPDADVVAWTYPAEIEAALERHPGIFDVVVFGIAQGMERPAGRHLGRPP